jgi:hypothetical protein
MSQILGIQPVEKKPKSNIMNRIHKKSNFTLADCIAASSAGKKLHMSKVRKTIVKKQSTIEDFPSIGNQQQEIRRKSDYSDTNLFDLLDTVTETIKYSESILKNISEKRRTTICYDEHANVPYEHFENVQKMFRVTRIKMERLTIIRILGNLSILKDKCKTEDFERLSVSLKKTYLEARAIKIDCYFEAYNDLMILRLFYRECYDAITPISDRVYDAYNDTESNINKTFNTNSVVVECDAMIQQKQDYDFERMFNNANLRESQELREILQIINTLLKLPELPFDQYSDFRKACDRVLDRIDNLVSNITRENDEFLPYVKYLVNIQDSQSQAIEAKGIVSWLYLPLEKRYKPITIVNRYHVYPMPKTIIENDSYGFDDYAFMDFLFHPVTVENDGFIKFCVNGRINNYLYLVDDTIPRCTTSIHLLNFHKSDVCHQIPFQSIFPKNRISDNLRKKKELEIHFNNEFFKRTRDICHNDGVIIETELAEQIKKLISVELRREIYGIVVEDDTAPISPEQDLDDLFNGLISDSFDSEKCQAKLERMYGKPFFNFSQECTQYISQDFVSVFNRAICLNWFD